MESSESATQEQLNVINSKSDKVVVLAGPGTGKTATISMLVSRLVSDGVAPESIAVVTFSRRAAAVIRERVGSVGAEMKIGTFHSVIMKAMKEVGSNYRAIDEDEQAIAMDECASGLGYVLGGKYIKKNRQHFLKMLRAVYLGLCEPDEVVEAYLSRLAIRGEVDYDGILFKGLEMARRGEFVNIKHLIVDEGQDNDQLQWDLVDEFTKFASVTVFGQTSQCIHEWRGAQPDRMMLEGAEVLNLTQSFRCPGQVLMAINQSSIADVQMQGAHDDESIKVFNGPISSVVYKAMEQMFGIADIAVLCRYNKDVEAIAEELEQHGLPVSTTITRPKGPVYKLLKYLCHPGSASLRSEAIAALEPYRNICKSDVIEWITSPIGIASCEMLTKNWLRSLGVLYGPEEILNAAGLPHCLAGEANYFKSEYSGDTLDAFETDSSGVADFELSQTPGITVITMHASKGMEFPFVILHGADQMRPTDKDRRLLYVAMSRASEQLFIYLKGESELLNELLNPDERRDICRI